MKIELLSHTPEPEKLIASAGKLCYSKVGASELKNMTDEEVTKFLDILISLGHESPLEHVSFTFSIEGVSRVLSHQLVRHRIASYSQQSQRYVNLDGIFEYITPPAIENNWEANDTYKDIMDEIYEAYLKITNTLLIDYCSEFLKINPVTILGEEGYDDLFDLIHSDYIIGLEYFKKEFPKQYTKFEKKAIEDARFILPNACETKLVATMNARSLLNFFSHRECDRAQWEIREMAEIMLRLVKEVAPTVFKNAGAPCRRGKCPEGKLSCGNSKGVDIVGVD